MHAEHIAVGAQLLERPQNDPGLEQEWITVLLKKSTLSFLKKEISALSGPAISFTYEYFLNLFLHKYLRTYSCLVCFVFFKKSAAVNKNNKYSKQNKLLFILDYKGTKGVEEASS